MKKKIRKSLSRSSPRVAQAAESVSNLSPLELELDPFNPRLPPTSKGKGQRQIVEVMLDRFAINEIAESICTAGFVPLDPFIGYRADSKVIMLEGNRRLATLQLLLDPTLTPDRYKNAWADFRRRLNENTREAIKRISVLVYPTRKSPEVLAYIGYRHASGIMGWDAEEKAAFIAQLVEDNKWSYEEIANTIGSKAAYVEKLYVAHRLIEQAKQDGVAGADVMRNSFGVLTRAMQSPGVTRFLGVRFPRDPRKSHKPATAPKRDVEDFVRWTFGTTDVKPVLEDSRDLTKWGQILSSAESVRYLRSADDPRFDRAYSRSGGLIQGLVDALLAAADRLSEAVPLVRQHRESPDVKTAVARCADYMAQVLTYFPEEAEAQGLKLNDAPAASK
ncbi:MAG: hypothetical protein QOH01_2952 [Verrucomicrobiota bacterium]|jgi:hypothetical protein